MKILMATSNLHKVQEIQNILERFDIEVISFKDLEIPPPNVIEDGKSFYENAKKKAMEIAQATEMYCLADDSGLEVDFLNGEPGIYSARFAGKNATDKENLEKLLFVMKRAFNRDARFVCSLVLVNPEGKELVAVEGYVYGTLLKEARGNRGFGYDPIFAPNGYDRSFAEMGSIIKDQISHRASALQKMLCNSVFQKIQNGELK